MGVVWTGVQEKEQRPKSTFYMNQTMRGEVPNSSHQLDLGHKKEELRWISWAFQVGKSLTEGYEDHD